MKFPEKFSIKKRYLLNSLDFRKNYVKLEKFHRKLNFPKIACPEYERKSKNIVIHLLSPNQTIKILIKKIILSLLNLILI